MVEIKSITSRLWDSYEIWKQLTRGLPYTEFFFMVIPFFSLLVSADVVSSLPLVISLMLPLVLLVAGGFTYNQISDAHIDSVEKNPITRGAISKRAASLLSLAFLLASIISFLMFYTSMASFLLFALHIFFWYAYSGLKIRFKETLVGVFVASFVFWIAPSLIILAQFNYLTNTAIALLIFIFLTYTNRDILHTLLDYEIDGAQGSRTFAVRLGRRNTIIIMHTLLSIAGVFTIVNSFISGDIILQVLSVIYGTCYAAIVGIQVLTYKIRHDLSFLWMSGRWPFFFSRLYLLVLSLIFLRFSFLLCFLVVWIFLTTRHY
jgi:4-hydroxybenzoate polyprenyltransferase